MYVYARTQFQLHSNDISNEWELCVFQIYIFDCVHRSLCTLATGVSFGAVKHTYLDLSISRTTGEKDLHKYRYRTTRDPSGADWCNLMCGKLDLSQPHTLAHIHCILWLLRLLRDLTNTSFTPHILYVRVCVCVCVWVLTPVWQGMCSFLYGVTRLRRASCASIPST